MLPGNDLHAKLDAAYLRETKLKAENRKLKLEMAVVKKREQRAKSALAMAQKQLELQEKNLNAFVELYDKQGAKGDIKCPACLQSLGSPD